MIRQGTFDELINRLDPFDRRLVQALATLRKRQDGTTLQTSHFELCHLLGIEYSPQNASRVDKSLGRLRMTPLHMRGPQSGFALTTRAIATVEKETGSETLTIGLGKLFAL